MNCRNARKLFLILGLCYIPDSQVLAATISISPVELVIKDGERVTSFELTNDSDNPIDLETSSTSWDQTNSLESKQPTNNLIISPAIFHLNPSAHQVVRVAERNAHSDAYERAYRVILVQIPDRSQTGVQMLLRFDLPLFVAGKGAVPRMQWSLIPSLLSSRLTATNSGSAHLTITSVYAEVGQEKIVLDNRRRTILAGGEVRIELPLKPFTTEGAKLFYNTNLGPVRIALPQK